MRLQEIEFPNWRKQKLRSAALRAPNSPGVYVIGKAHSFWGLPRFYEWAYIGRSDSLRRRLKDHLPMQEKNRGLQEWLIKNLDSIEVWYLSTGKAESRAIEKRLIKSLNPKHNVIRYIGD